VDPTAAVDPASAGGPAVDEATEPAGVVFGVGDAPIGVLGVEQEAISGVKISRPALPAPKRKSWRREIFEDMVFNLLHFQ
jgi:hypothetical protein